MISMSPASFADHSEITITPVSGSGSGSGCELTEEGCYSPNTATVDVGGVVIFLNTDSVAHTFSSGVPSDDIIGTEFNSGMLAPGDSAEWNPENTGEFPYFDMIHPWMEGLIIVQDVVEETHTEDVVEETHTEDVVEETHTEDVVEETHTEDVVEETHTEDVVEETHTEDVVEEEVVVNQESEEEGGGCLIATAAYGSEMAPQVQLLREIRDNQLMNTESGTNFMNTFNDIYYSFSPTIADMERESPMFKEAVKISLTPLLSSLTIMENAESESEVLGLGLSVIALNLGMYIGLPAFGIVKLIQIRKN
jgi:plastocyanin